MCIELQSTKAQSSAQFLRVVVVKLCASMMCVCDIPRSQKKTTGHLILSLDVLKFLAVLR